MKRLIPIGMLVTAAVAVPAYATSTHANTHSNTHSKHCKHSTLRKAYVFGGTLINSAPTITQTAGQGTASKADDRYTVALDFTVTHANKYAKPDHANGSEFNQTLTDVRVSFGSNTDSSQRTPQVGDSVNVKGTKAFKVKHNCQADPNEPVGTVKYVKVSFGDQPQPQP